MVANEYFAPDLLFAETTNTIWKKIRRGELKLAEGRRLVSDINRVAVGTISCRTLTEDAHTLAHATGQTVYGALYVALAVRLDTCLVTADDRLEAALSKVPALARHVPQVDALRS